MRYTNFDNPADPIEAPTALPVFPNLEREAARLKVCPTCPHSNDDQPGRPCDLLVPIARDRNNCCPAQLYRQLVVSGDPHPDPTCLWHTTENTR